MRNGLTESVLTVLDSRHRLTTSGAAEAAKAATMKGMISRERERAAHLGARVLWAISALWAEDQDRDAAIKFYVDALWQDCPPEYQGLMVKALADGEFSFCWRMLSRGRVSYYRPELAYQVALFGRNWLKSGRSVARLNDFANYLSRL